MDNLQAQTSSNILNHLCKFINNKPVTFSRVAGDLRLDINEVESCIEAMMAIHPDWYTIKKRMWGGNAVMLNATALKDIHKFLVLGGYAELANNSAAPARKAEAKDAKPEEKSAAARNTVIIKSTLDLNHS
jgi:hypothetical protein